MAFQNRTETPSPPTMTKDLNQTAAVSQKNSNNCQNLNNLNLPPLLMPKPSKSVVIPPKKPARQNLIQKMSSQSAVGSVGNVGSAVELRRESSTLGTESVKHKKSDSILSTSAPTGNHGKTFYLLLKGQLISNCPFGVIVWTKIPTKLFLESSRVFGTFCGGYKFQFHIGCL